MGFASEGTRPAYGGCERNDLTVIRSADVRGVSERIAVFSGKTGMGKDQKAVRLAAESIRPNAR